MHSSSLHACPPALLQASHGGVAVRGLFAASPSQLALLKQGEQEKQKSYVAVGTACLFWVLERLAAGLLACGMHIVSAWAAAG